MENYSNASAIITPVGQHGGRNKGVKVVTWISHVKFYELMRQIRKRDESSCAGNAIDKHDGGFAMSKYIAWISRICVVLVWSLLATGTVRAETFELWSHRMPLTFSLPTGAALTNFPVLVEFGTHLAGFDYANFADPATNADLRFAGPDLDVTLPYEVENWDTNGISHVWVRVPELRGTGETIRAYWGRPGETAPDYRTNGVVWAADYVGVWHLNEEAAGVGGGYIYKDSTTNNFHGRDYVASTNKDGRIYRGQEFVTNTFDYIQVTNNSAFNFTTGSSDLPFTLSAWVYTTGDRIQLFNKATNTSAAAIAWRSQVITNGVLWLDLADGGAGTNNRITMRSVVGSVPSNEWAHVVMSYNASASTSGVAFYVNGAAVGIESAWKGPAYTNMRVTTSTVDIGASLRADTTYRSYAKGFIDEGRISRGVRSPEWIRSAYLTVASNDVFMTYGVVQTSDTGLGVVAQPPSAIRAIEATVDGVMLDVGGGDNPSVYVCWDATDKTAVNTGDWAHVEFVGVKAAFESFNHVLTPLERGGDYAHRFYVTNSAGSAWSGLRTFTTIDYPSVTQGGASAIGRYGATLNGDVTATGGESPLTGFDWWPVVAGAPTTTVTGSVSPGAFVTSVTGLSLSTEYAFKAWASNVAGMVWSDTGVWTTRDMTPVTYTWSGPANGDWFTAANWTPNGVPGDGVDTAQLVNAASSILLAGATEPLAAFVMTNGTLTFSTTAAVLRADHVEITGGTNTHVVNSATTTNLDGTWAVDGRVYFACSNFTLLAPGKIDANAKGYRSVSTLTKGYGPGGGGAGTSGSKGAGGGGHGSAGIKADSGGAGGVANDDAFDPVYPGSAGGSGIGGVGGFGGGLVRIEATNAVTISGTITANGGNADTTVTSRGGGGSGGGIYIGCRVLAGTNGLISANAGERADNGGPGGSGRIAISFDPVAQAAAPKPRIAMTVKRSTTDQSTSHTYSDIGTLSITDASLFDGGWMPHTGALVCPAFTNWMVDVLNITNGWIRFPVPPEMFALTVSNAMTISGSGGLLQISRPEIRCGSLTLTNGASLYLYPKSTNSAPDEPDYGGIVVVSNAMTLASGCWVYPNAVSTNGGGMLFRVGSLDVATNAGFNANDLGFLRAYRVDPTTYAAYGPGKGPSATGFGSGAGHGGRGGRSLNTSSRGDIYDDPLRPMLPGSGGGTKNNNNSMGGMGGGLVRIEANGLVNLAGTLTVNGQDGQNYGGGGSGGSIFVKCLSFSGASTGRLIAEGGGGCYSSDGAGGGGMVAVWYGPWNSGQITPERLADRGTNRPAAFLGSESVICGTLSYTNDAENGTVHYVEVLALKGSLILFR